ncbi:glycosyl transferase family 1 [candidate division GN15 bacterium]|uniref:Glycosyl transferase family 1 n=1 Tax=candidate division GN15 bacterium TaxID=2072418 RepID=A0A855X2N2_9BACT|nr:MAG: glycosyl transferase family 1 [candidate division GN15 bacterium]
MQRELRHGLPDAVAPYPSRVYRTDRHRHYARAQSPGRAGPAQAGEATVSAHSNSTLKLLAKRTSVGTIAFCGTRGLPANYGGFETAVDEISRRFVDAGYRCDVFCRTANLDNTSRTRHRGRYLIHVRGSRRRSMDTFVSSIQTGMYLLRHRRKYHHAFWFNNANLPGILLTRLARIPMTVNTDGLEWRRAKWSWPFKLYYILSSLLVSIVCRSLVSDSLALQRYYKRRFLRKSNFVPYGAPGNPDTPLDRQRRILQSLKLEPGRYFLQITRIEPDNLPLEVAVGFADSRLGRDGYSMVTVGYKDDTPYSRQLLAFNGRYGIHVLNAIYDPDILYALRANCYCYLHGNSVGGTNPALLEAMAFCPRVLALDCEFSREVLGETGTYFDRENIADAFKQIPAAVSTEAMLNRVRSLYRWDAVAESYMQLCHDEEAVYNPTKYVSDSEVATRHESKRPAATEKSDERIRIPEPTGA